MNLDAKAVVLRLHADHPELLDHGLGIGKALRELGAERMTRPDLQRLEPGLAGVPERARDQAEVGGAVVGTLQDGPQCAVSFPGERQSVEHCRVANAQPHLAQRDANQMLGRHGIEVIEKADEGVELPLLAAPTAGGRDLGQAAVHVDHIRSVTGAARSEALYGGAEVADLLVELDHFDLRNLVRGSDRIDEKPLPEADLDRLEEGREPALDKVCDWAKLVGRTRRVDLGKDGDQLVALCGRLHPVEVCGELGKVHLSRAI